MLRKMFKFLILASLTIGGIVSIFYFELNTLPVGSSLGGLIAGFTLSPLWSSIVDFSDNTTWKTSQRRLQRAKLITKETHIRISFAYLFRIKVDGKYFLIKNSRGTEKFQPVGGVYKFNDSEALYLAKNFYVEHDNKISVDGSSKLDYRLRVKNKYLRKMVKRFNKGRNRESITNLTREFVEELLDTKILDKNHFSELSYTYCGQHISNVKFSEHFQCYELLLADVVSVELTAEQEHAFRSLKESDQYMLASDEEIKSLGIKTDTGVLIEKIADHSAKILIENADSLNKRHGNNKEFTCKIK